VDLAREHGLSAQAVWNYEGEGILPRAGPAGGYKSGGCSPRSPERQNCAASGDEALGGGEDELLAQRP
jgi:hypothetical protein